MYLEWFQEWPRDILYCKFYSPWYNKSHSKWNHSGMFRRLRQLIPLRCDNHVNYRLWRHQTPNLIRKIIWDRALIYSVASFFPYQARGFQSLQKKRKHSQPSNRRLPEQFQWLSWRAFKSSPQRNPLGQLGLWWNLGISWEWSEILHQNSFQV